VLANLSNRAISDAPVARGPFHVELLHGAPLSAGSLTTLAPRTLYVLRPRR
jgi:hypothetical protein